MQMPSTESGSSLVKQMRRKSRTYAAPFQNDPTEEEDEQDEVEEDGELEWSLNILSENELRQQYRELYTKLMMSARLGQELLDREDSYKHQLSVMQHKLDRFEEQEIYLRRAAEEQREQLVAQEQELSEISRERYTEQLNQSQLMEDANATENEVRQQRIQLRELQEQVHKLTVQNYDLSNQLAETTIETEAQARLNQELNGRLLKYNAARPRSAVSTISRPSSRPASRIAMRSESGDFPSPTQQPHFGQGEGGWDIPERDDMAFDPEQVFELEDQIAELTQLLAERDDIINELRDDLGYYRSLPVEGQATSPSHKSWAQEIDESMTSPSNTGIVLEPIREGRQSFNYFSLGSHHGDNDENGELQEDDGQYLESEYEREQLVATVRDLEQQLAEAQEAYSALEYQNSCLKTFLKTKNAKGRRQSRAILFPEGYIPDSNPDELIAIPDSNTTPLSDIEYDSHSTTSTPMIDSPVVHAPPHGGAGQKRHVRHQSTPITAGLLAQENLNANPDASDDEHPDDELPPRSKSMSAVPAAHTELEEPAPVDPHQISSPRSPHKNTLNLANLQAFYTQPQGSAITVDTESQCDTLIVDTKSVQCDVGPTADQMQQLKQRIEQLERELQQRAVAPAYAPPANVNEGYHQTHHPEATKSKSSGWCWPFVCCGKQDHDDEDDIMVGSVRTEKTPLLQSAY